MLYAYLRSLDPPRLAFTSLYIPLFNAAESDIDIRPEFAALFHHANISASHLITRDDLPPSEKLCERLKPANTRWILVDHNKLLCELGSIYSSSVLGVIDHHEDEKAVPQDTYPEPRVIEQCGSCTSLVVRTLQSSWDKLSNSALSSGAGHAQGEIIADDAMVRRVWDAQIAKMALASILIDTTNLTAESKVKAVDRDAVEYLEAKIQLSPKNMTWDRLKFYREIDEAKKNIEAFDLSDILRKDYKEWTENGIKLGVSSVEKPLEFLVSKAQRNSVKHEHEAFQQAAKDFMESRSLSIFSIMTAFTSGDQFRRELYLRTNSSAGSDSISKFSECATSKLNLEDTTVEGISSDDYHPAMDKDSYAMTRIWLQKDTTKSRKQVAPLLRAAMS